MKWLLRLLVSVVAAGLALLAVIFVLNQTIWNADYLKARATQTNLAGELASSIPAAAAAYAPGPETKAAVGSVVTPGYVDTQLQTILPGIVDAYKHDGPTPSLNLTDISSGFTASGVPLPSNLQSVLNQPQPVVPAAVDAPLRTTARLAHLLLIAVPLAVIGAALMIVLLARRRRFFVLAEGILGGAVLVALAALLAQLPPHLIGATLSNSPVKVLEPAVSHYLQSIASDQTHRLLWLAAILAGVGLILLIAHFVGHMLRRFKKEPAPDAARPPRVPES